MACSNSSLPRFCQRADADQLPAPACRTRRPAGPATGASVLLATQITGTRRSGAAWPPPGPGASGRPACRPQAGSRRPSRWPSGSGPRSCSVRLSASSTPMPPVSTSSKKRSSKGEQVGHPVAGHAGGRIDDGDPLAGQPIEEARLAHVGPADDDNLWNTHEKPLSLNPARCPSLSYPPRSRAGENPPVVGVGSGPHQD